MGSRSRGAGATRSRSRPLVWFRADLRVRDNTALARACAEANDGVVGVFALCPHQWKSHHWSGARVEFVLRNLEALSRELSSLGIPLVVVQEPLFAHVPIRLVELARDHRCTSLWMNLEYEVNERQRDAKVIEAFAADGLGVNAFTDQVAVSPHDVRTGAGGYYSVFGPFLRKWLATLEHRTPAIQRKPRRQAIRPKVASSRVPRQLPGFSSRVPESTWPAGEQHAHARLRSFVRTRMEHYDTHRDVPHLDATSTLSPYLAAGVLSVRQCLGAASGGPGKLLTGLSAGATRWCTELAWREFYRHVLAGFPRVCMDRPFDVRTESVRWRDDDEAFVRWREGKTGIPIVDAGMRQLGSTGWMHNRLRMITATFLTKNLLIDWRRGERHFMAHLVDGDFANNNGGWQWCASTGTDAVPYFRVFNAVAQSRRFDPEGEVIRRFVPELRGVSPGDVHLPPPSVREVAGYPAPMVDLGKTRQRAIDEFRRALGRARRAK